MAETETFSDNATGTLIGTFLLHLGGTATPYRERLRWWDRQYAEAERGGDTAKATLLARVLAAGLNEHESRTGAWHGVLHQPVEYRPSREDAIALRGDIWRRLFDLTTSTTADQDVVTEMIAAHLRMAVRYPFAAQVLDRVTGLADLMPSRRAALGDALRAALRFDGDALPEHIRQAVEACQAAVLGGPGVLDRLPAILSTPVWHLDDPYTGEPPQVLVESADALLASREPPADRGGASPAGRPRADHVRICASARPPRRHRPARAVARAPYPAIACVYRTLARPGRACS